jgi:hypothetical protein
MRDGETEPDMIRRHVEEGAQHIAQQRALIGHLRQEDLATGEAEALLVLFEDIQRQHQDHLARIETSGRDDIA